MTEKQKIEIYTYTPKTEDQSIAHKIISYPIEKLKVVFYNPDDVNKPVKGFYDMVIRNNKKDGKKFYGVRSSKYGMRVPADATHFAIAGFGAKKINKIYSMELIKPYAKTQVMFGTEYKLIVRRATKNMFFVFGKNEPKVVKAKKPSKIDVVNEKWTQL